MIVKMENAFYIDAYMKNGELHGDVYMKDGKIHTKGVQKYLERNSIYISENQMLLIGRALKDFTSEDILLTKSNTPICIYKFHLYGHEMDLINTGCTCAIICSFVSENFITGDVLRLQPKNKLTQNDKNKSLRFIKEELGYVYKQQ